MFGGPTPLFVVSFYGWANGHDQRPERDKTERLLDLIVQEVGLLKGASVVLCGDLNCEIGDVPSLALEVAASRLVDLGACQHLNGNGPPVPTCLAHGAKQMAR
eukprot:4994849-Alexandrium_andersonii.AAC.1